MTLVQAAAWVLVALCIELVLRWAGRRLKPRKNIVGVPDHAARPIALQAADIELAL